MLFYKFVIVYQSIFNIYLLFSVQHIMLRFGNIDSYRNYISTNIKVIHIITFFNTVWRFRINKFSFCIISHKFVVIAVILVSRITISFAGSCYSECLFLTRNNMISLNFIFKLMTKFRKFKPYILRAILTSKFSAMTNIHTTGIMRFSSGLYTLFSKRSMIKSNGNP